MGDEYENMEGLEVQPDPEDVSMASDAGMAPAGEAVEQEGDILDPVPEASSEDASDVPVADSEVLDSVTPDRVAQIVDAVLSDDRVTGLLDSFSYTMETVADMASAAAVAADREEDASDPVVVISADDLLDRLEARQAETAKAAQDAAQASVRSSPMDGQTVTASMTKGGELVLPDEGEVSLVVIEALLEGLIDFFTQDGTEDGTDVLTSIKDTVEEIAANVEPHSFLDTPFEDYTVVEGLLLVLVLWFAVLNPCIKMLKGGFSWLLS